MDEDVSSIRAYVPRVRHEFIAMISAVATILTFIKGASLAFNGGNIHAMLFMLIIYLMYLAEMSIIQYIFCNIAFSKYITIENKKVYVGYRTSSSSVKSIEEITMPCILRCIFGLEDTSLLRIKFYNGKTVFIDGYDKELYSQLNECIE